MLNQLLNRVLPLVVVSASLTLTACGGGSEQEVPIDELTSELEVTDQPATGALSPNPSNPDNAETPDASDSNPEPEPVETPSETTDTRDENSATDSPEQQQPTDAINNQPDAVDSDADADPAAPDDTESDTGDNESDSDQESVGRHESEPESGAAFASVVTPSESDPFSKFQLENSLYTNNVYDGRQLDPDNNWKLIFYDGVQDFVRWEVPAVIGDSASPCERSHAGNPVQLSYRLTSRKDSPHERNTFVRSYPAMVVGSMGGRYESWGVECGQVDTILPSAQRHGGSPVFQMETVAAATGLPALAGDLDYDVRVSVKADLNTESAVHGIANVFMDSYWHNVSDIDLVPGNAQELVNTINGISSDYTEVWNLNIWFDYPRHEGSASSWTGGFNIGSVTLQEGGEFDVYFKIEGSRDGHLPRCRLGTNVNCFLYIGLVATDEDSARNGVTVNYTEIADWMRSADFRDLFLTGAFETDTPSARAFEAWQMIDGEDNDAHPDPANRGPRFPDENHVIGGIHLGSELWYNPDAVPATIAFEALGVEVEGIGQFGNYVDYE